MKPRVVLAPRWGGTPSHDFYPWLRTELGALGVELSALHLPNPGTPTIDAWVPAVRVAIEDALEAAAPPPIVVGHSVGCQAVMRALACFDRPVLSACLLVAAWWHVDEPWPSIRPWIDTPFEHARARAAVARFSVLLSDDDPFTRDHAHTAALFRERLGANVRIAAGAKHFNGDREPIVLASIAELLPVAEAK
jgi:predicted alpha/beta hydrolase family esterase